MAGLHYISIEHEEYDDGDVDWWAQCSCGWFGSTKRKWMDADEEAEDHEAFMRLRQVSGEPIPASGWLVEAYRKAVGRDGHKAGASDATAAPECDHDDDAQTRKSGRG